MDNRWQIWLVVGAVGAVAISAVTWHHREGAELRRELAAARQLAVERLRLDEEHTRLLAKQPSEAELAALREDRASLDKLRANLDTIKAAASQARLAPKPAAHIKPALVAEMMPASAWKPQGRATPAAAFETVAWARLHGHIDVFTAALRFATPAVRAQAEALVASLPPGTYDHRGSPERLIALLASHDVSLESDSIRVVEEHRFDEADVRAYQQQQPDVSDLVILRAELQTGNGPKRHKALQIHRTFDGWKFVIPASAVEDYATRLRTAKGE